MTSKWPKWPVYLLALLAIITIEQTAAEKVLSFKVGEEYISKPKRESCEQIEVPFCRNLPYTRTSKFDADGRRIDQRLIINELTKYELFFKFNCSSFFESFICSYHLPLCSVHPLLPCRELCQQVRRDCFQAITENHFDWPDELECHKFQAYKETRMCFKPKELDNVRAPPAPAIARADPTPNFTCPMELEKPDNERFVFRIASHSKSNCSYPCHDFLYDRTTERQARTSILVIATVGLLLNLFLQITYRIDTNRFKYPLKAIVHISLCYALISAVYLVVHLAGDVFACDPTEHSNAGEMVKTLANGQRHACMLSFVLVNFLTACSLLWWLMLAVTFFLEMVLMWATEVIEQRNALFHLAILALAALHTAITAARVELQGDALSGLCTVSLNEQLNYLILPQLAVLLLGLLIFAVTIAYFFKIKQFLKLNSVNMNEFENFVHKLLAFLLLCLIGYGGQFLIYYYELHNFDLWVRQWWRSVCERFVRNCPQYWIQLAPGNRRPTLLFVILKYLAHFLPCIACGSLLFCRKTLKIWSDFCKRLFRRGAR